MFPAGTAVLILSGPLFFLLPSCAPQQLEPASSFEHTISTQIRVNRYLHDQVVPQLRDCWSRLSGEGKVLVRHVYTNSGQQTWSAEPDRITVEESDLGEDQQKAAVECMQRAVAGTSFAMTGAEREEEEFVLYWGWPVPLPSEEPVSTALYLGAGGGVGGGCDGQGTPARCQTCIHVNGFDCVRVCVGWDECIITKPDPQTTICRKINPCASGGPFGLVGGAIVAQ